MLDLIERAFDAVVPAVEGATEAVPLPAVGLVRYVGRGALVLDMSPDPVGIVALVGEDDGARGEIVEQLSGGLAVGRLTQGEREADRSAARVCPGIDLGAQSSSAAAHTTISTAFF